MSVRVSESTANRPAHHGGPKGIAQNQFVYVVFFDDNDKRHYVIDITGNIFGSEDKAPSRLVQAAIDRSIGLGPVLFMAGAYDLELNFPEGCAIVGSGYDTIFNCNINANRLSITDMVVTGSMTLRNCRLERVKTTGLVNCEYCRFWDCDITEIWSHNDTIAFSTIDKCSASQTTMLQGDTIESLDVSANATGIIANNIIKHYKESPNSANINNNIGIKTQAYGTQTISADGIKKEFVFRHGLIRSPVYVNVNAGSNGSLRQPFWWNWTSEDIMVCFLEPPKAGRNNIILYWFASI